MSPKRKRAPGEHAEPDTSEMTWRSRERNLGIPQKNQISTNTKLVPSALVRHLPIGGARLTYSPNIVCNITEMKSIFLRPNLSDKYPLNMPPVATPARKNISATFFMFLLSHTKSHSEVHVCPRPSVELYSQAVHFMSCWLSCDAFQTGFCEL